MQNAVLLDTSFFIRMLDPYHALQEKAQHYFQYFKDQDFVLAISAISIAEYCVKGRYRELPTNSLKIIPFELEHALRAGEFAFTAFNARKTGVLETSQRLIIPNDVKLFAQADTEPAIMYYISSDVESLKIYESLQAQNPVNFDFIDLNQPLRKVF